MLRRSAVLCIGQLLLAVTIAAAKEAPVTECDTLAASPLDLHRKAAGVPFEELNPTVAIPACENAVRDYPNSPRLIYQLGRAYQRVNDFSAALIQYRKAAEQGYASAQNNLGAMYQLGQGVPKDLTQAIAWVRKAAANGDPTAQFSLGVVYENGNGVQKDLAQAIDWYRKAAEQGHPAARAKLGPLVAAMEAARKESEKQGAAKKSEEEAAKAKRIADAQAAVEAKKRAEEEAAAKRTEAERRAARIEKQGLDYASRRETSWQLISTKNEMIDKVESIAISWQENENGAGAEVVGKCENKDILFTATVLDRNKKGMVQLPWITRMPTSAELNWQGSITGSYDFRPIAILPVTVRLNDNPPMTRVRKHDGKYGNAVPLILFRHEHWMLKPGAGDAEKDNKANEFLKLLIGIEDDVLFETWRVIVQFDTSVGTILIKIPMYDNNVQKMIKSCS